MDAGRGVFSGDLQALLAGGQEEVEPLELAIEVRDEGGNVSQRAIVLPVVPSSMGKNCAVLCDPSAKAPEGKSRYPAVNSHRQYRPGERCIEDLLS